MLPISPSLMAYNSRVPAQIPSLGAVSKEKKERNVSNASKSKINK